MGQGCTVRGGVIGFPSPVFEAYYLESVVSYAGKLYHGEKSHLLLTFCPHENSRSYSIFRHITVILAVDCSIIFDIIAKNKAH